MPGAVHQIEKGMMGWDPNRPTENLGLLLLLAPHSQGPLEIKEQQERQQEGDSDIERWTKESEWGKQEGCHESEKPMWPSVITQTPAPLPSQKNNQRDFLENVCETFTLSQGILFHPAPDEMSSDLNSIITCYGVERMCCFDTLKKDALYSEELLK
ncbi:hypothetical protein PBY51_000914 [Eleginops maclovinus]|uniref:Uncharacterized protein n=1 Tax=Eleginops maclovinus TaxID=56733 RepID=A0AAN7XKU4_ELEMC|nr:hypothetical protein PBY51_000914 [Eleginops maclovinus]